MFSNRLFNPDETLRERLEREENEIFYEKCRVEAAKKKKEENQKIENENDK
jgi:hypothetical protein